MKLEDRAEEMLESLWVELIERKLKVRHLGILKDDATLEELSSEGYVSIKNNRLSLTEKGESEAKNCIRRHRLAERLMVDVLDVKGMSVHEKGCRLEHALHRGLDEDVCTLLGHPTTCPHGKPIPEGECCRGARKRLNRLIMPLTDMPRKREATVAYIRTQDRGALQKMIAMGILPNVKIVVLQKFPAYVLRMGKSEFAVDKALAANVYVRP